MYQYWNGFTKAIFCQLVILQEICRYWHRRASCVSLRDKETPSGTLNFECNKPSSNTLSYFRHSTNHTIDFFPTLPCRSNTCELVPQPLFKYNIAVIVLIYSISKHKHSVCCLIQFLLINYPIIKLKLVCLIIFNL